LIPPQGRELSQSAPDIVSLVPLALPSVTLAAPFAYLRASTTAAVRAFHGPQAFGMQLGAAMILQHQSDPELARRTGDGFEEGALGQRRGIGVAGLRSGSAIEHEGRVAHTAADHVSGR
jgi:hypothetical protein